ncbi:hypothetical protein [Flavobacterium microcysteis]|uniref:Uncharacterized protein n=1 Tax=Flavobacterium microcysteis TaxID=2596891 RepID=A0A501Q1F9_9FLAO|nr:hypothetical protein [Flavobacterium microcysteis]TPD65836.1 hypothetical protein FJA49_16785 [Flavobacterium microcysteis]
MADRKLTIAAEIATLIALILGGIALYFQLNPPATKSGNEKKLDLKNNTIIGSPIIIKADSTGHVTSDTLNAKLSNDIDTHTGGTIEKAHNVEKKDINNDVNSQHYQSKQFISPPSLTNEKILSKIPYSVMKERYSNSSNYGTYWKGKYEDDVLGSIDATLSIQLYNDLKIDGVFTFYPKRKKYLLFRIKGFVENDSIFFYFNEFANSDYTNTYNVIKFRGLYSFRKNDAFLIGNFKSENGLRIVLKTNEKYYSKEPETQGTFNLIRTKH